MRRALFLLCLAGCSAGRSCGPDDPRFQAALVAETLKSLRADSGAYEVHLVRLEERLTPGASPELAKAVAQLRARVRPEVRTDETCPSEVMGTFVLEALEGLKNGLLSEGSTVAPAHPQLCQVTPASLPDTLGDGAVQPVRFHGWDLDRAPFTLWMIDEQGQRTDATRSLRRRGPFLLEATFGTPELGPRPGLRRVVLERDGQKLAELAVAPHHPPVEVVVTRTESAPAQHPKVEVRVPQDHLLIGGGCLAHWSLEGQLLTASHPIDGGWACASKDHTTPEVGTVEAFALSVPKSSGLQVITSSASGVLAGHPTAKVELPEGYTLIGGGCRADFGRGAGSLLVNAYPEGAAWICAAKDHVNVSPGVVTAWAIGVVLPKEWSVVQVATTSSIDHHPETSALLPLDGTTLVGGGCRTDYGSSGTILWSVFPDRSANGFRCAAKEHRASDRGTLTATAFGLKLRSAP